MRGLVHQPLENTALQVDKRTVITAFEIDVVLIEQLPVDDRLNTVSLAERRDRADLAVHEQVLEFLFGGKADRMGE
jgi:hypothetical protein